MARQKKIVTEVLSKINPAYPGWLYRGAGETAEARIFPGNELVTAVENGWVDSPGLAEAEAEEVAAEEVVEDTPQKPKKRRGRPPKEIQEVAEIDVQTDAGEVAVHVDEAGNVEVDVTENVEPTETREVAEVAIKTDQETITADIDPDGSVELHIETPDAP